MNEENRRKSKSVSGRRSDQFAIVINVGAGSLLPHDPDRDIAATRRGLQAIRDTARTRVESARKPQNNDSA
jgi:hypothetical protein